MEYVSIGELVDADRDGKPRELVFELRAGAAARAVQAKIVAFRAGAGGCVEVRKTLFSYPTAATIGSRPKGTFFSSGSITLRDFSKRYSGRELRTLESYGRATDPGCCPSYSRTTFWRYVKARSRYEPFRTKPRAAALSGRSQRAVGVGASAARAKARAVADGEQDAVVAVVELDAHEVARGWRPAGTRAIPARPSDRSGSRASAARRRRCSHPGCAASWRRRRATVASRSTGT